MDKKTVFLVIIFAIVIGVTIFFMSNLLGDKNTGANTNSDAITKPSPTPSPTPLPSLPPIDKNTNLGEEIKKTTPPDYSQDIQRLKDEVKN